ncbi:xylulose kinase-like [Ruditapes philippinarum]|uniref:xylulose kinase-like n=1 Tax=Ruditapes philippinarum TaxID=129788 RepID=UPI00295C2727|nr:xylulose kinase-like [Ruditapes philippinarum]
MESEKYYLGLDFSTQQIKLIAVDDNLKVVYEEHIKFETDLPEFGTVGGTVTAPAAMWVKALDMLLDKMMNDGFDFSKVAGISGDGQELARLTGSRGFERYTGTQIMKIYQTNKEAYDNTERISLVSSMAASLFIGDYAPIDYGDGSGMNILDIRNKVWSAKCLQACGPGLADKLGEPVSSKTVVGSVSSYMCKKYGFQPSCKVVAFTGDNMCSLAGLAPKKGDVMVSLGSSDTVFLWLHEATPGTDGHIFVNPLDSNTFMGLVCFKNGSLTRENVMNRCAGSWEKFNEMLSKTPPGNNGNIGIYFDKKEIQPVVRGIFRFNENNEQVESFTPEVEVRAVLESQFLARLMYAKLCGLQIGPESRVIATGGASANPAILQIIADIFNTTVYITDVPNSAALGACYRAKHAMMPEGTPYSEIVKNLPEPVCACKHTPGLEKVYMPMMERYRKLEEKISAM